MKLRRRILWLLLATLASTPLFGERWYVRPDGGTRYSSKVTSGQCDGKTDAPCSGKGVNQHCVYSDFRYLLDEDRGGVGQGAWVIGGGDTVVVRGCKALSSQQHPSNPNCRVWRDMPTGNAPNRWCYGVGSYGYFNPPIPTGSASQQTRILGQNCATCDRGGATNPKSYGSNLTQLFGGLLRNAGNGLMPF